MTGKIPNTIFLFDVDGTLTVPRKHIEPDMQAFMQQLSKVATVGIVGGSDFSKQIEQLGDNLLNEYHYVFSENGLMYYKNGTLVERQSIKQALGEEKLKRFINFCLHYIADLDIPIKRGTFIEFRNGMLNISPIGRNCSQEEREDFEKYDLQHHIRADFVEALKRNFPDLDLVYSIGGQISFDVFPSGWDKTYCLKFLKNDNVDKIYFFGDKTMKGGNDYEIFTHPDTIGHSVNTYLDTMSKVKQILKDEYNITV